LAVALAECCFSPHHIGATINLDSDLRPELLLFHEGPSRILVSTANAARVQEIAAAHNIAALVIGSTSADRLTISNRGTLLIGSPVESLLTTWEGALEQKLTV
jgi:phosphoribosylformylglycinamidine synthase